MNAIKYLATAASLLCATALVSSCSDDDNDGPNGSVTTHVYLHVPDGTTSLTAGSDETITVAVTLSAAPKDAVSLEFAVDGTNASMLALDGNPVTIAAGTTTGSFTVKAAGGASLTESASFTFSLLADATKFDLRENVTVTLLPATATTPLTPEQQALVNGWKEKYGVDLTPWLGNVKLNGTLQFPGAGSRDPFVSPETINLSGSTLFTLSNDADADTPVLDMMENPMGMSEYLYRAFRRLTVDDREYFAMEEDGTGLELMGLIDWNATSDETFGVTLPGLRITSIANGKASVEFVAEGDNLIYTADGQPVHSDEYEMDLTYTWATSWIPFSYHYTAWERQLRLVESGDPMALELLTYGVSAAPATYLGINDVMDDAWEIDEEEDGVANLYVTPRGEIDFNAGTMTFEFPFDHADQNGYSRVNVVYTLK